MSSTEYLDEATFNNISQPDSTRKRLIYAWNYVEWGGAQIYTIALIREARKLFDVSVVIPNGSSKELLRFLDDLDVKYDFFGPAGDFDEAPTILRKFQRHWRKIKSEDALVRHLYTGDLRNSIVHLDLNPQHSFLSFYRLCRRAHVFFTRHNAIERSSLWRESLWAAKMRFLSRRGKLHIFCANENAKEYVCRFVSKKAAETITVTRAGIDPDMMRQIGAESFDRDSTLSRFNVAGDRTVVLTIGQFVDRKGRWPYLQCIRNIVRRRSDIHFLWVMPQFPNESDRARVEEFEVDDSFKMILSADVGRTRNELLRFFRTADIYVLPSFVEGVPISLLEAMALGLPCISTRVFGVPEAIVSGEGGLLIDPGDIEALEKAILRLVDDPGLRNRLAHRGQSFVLTKFDEREAARIAVAEYSKCL